MRYRKLADQMIEDIERGLLSHGQKMPSLRTLTRQFSVSMTTALNCYRNLEEQGWIVARPQSGFYVSLPMGAAIEPRSPHFKAKTTAAVLGRYGGDQMSASPRSGPFGISQLSPSLTPETYLRRSLKRGLVRATENLCHYPDVQGEPAFREALASHAAGHGFAFVAADVVTTGGCIDAVRLALETTTRVGDAVAISSPCFNGLLALLASLSRRVVEIPSLESGIDLQQLKLLMKNGDITVALFSSSHMNPQGSSLPVEQKMQLAAMANRYQVPLIEDDIYGELSYSGAAPLPIKYWDSAGYVLCCSSVSKTLSPSLRLGWCLPGRYHDAYVRRAQHESLGRNNIVEAGVADFILSGQYQKHLRRVRQQLFANMCAYRSLLSETLPADSAISQPQGGMVLWILVPGLCYEMFMAACVEADLDIRGGDQFSTLAHYNECFRINVSWAMDENYDACRTIEQSLHQLVALVWRCLER